MKLYYGLAILRPERLARIEVSEPSLRSKLWGAVLLGLHLGFVLGGLVVLVTVAPHALGIALGSFFAAFFFALLQEKK